MGGRPDPRLKIGTMDISLAPASIDERPILENLLQFYIYDFSEIVGGDVEDDGRFKERSLAPYWEQTWRHPFLFRADGNLAGFALIHQRSRLSGDTSTVGLGRILRDAKVSAAGHRSARRDPLARNASRQMGDPSAARKHHRRRLLAPRGRGVHRRNIRGDHVGRRHLARTGAVLRQRRTADKNMTSREDAS